MSRLQSLKLFVKQRLSAAVEEIFGHFERTITEYEEEMQRKLQRAASTSDPRRSVVSAEIQQVLVHVEEVPPEQQEWDPRLDQAIPEPPHIKVEQEELWTNQEAEQLQGLEKVKEEEDEDDEERSKSLQLHQSQTGSVAGHSTGRMEAEADGEDHAEAARNSGPHGCSLPCVDAQASVSSDPETEASEDDGEETRGPRSGLHPQRNSEVLASDAKCSAVQKSFVCCECGRKFGRKDSLRRHTRFHTGEKPYSCSVCGKRFSQRPNLIRHMRCHSGEKPFGCSFCDTSFAVRSALVNHMRIHTGEKPYSCLYCDKSFTQKGGLKKHMTVHTGEKPYGCPVCDKRFSQKANLTYHLSVHTGQKQFGCSVCDKRFTWQSQVKSHKCVGESSSSS